MSPKHLKKSKSNATTSSPEPYAEIKFPLISSKRQLQVNTVLQDQIICIDNVLNAKECASWTSFVDSLPLQLTPPKKRGEADRHNCVSSSS
jgi:hypothetical protein